MRTPFLVSLVLLSACGEERPVAAPTGEESVAPETRPGEAAILARWDAAHAEITRVEAEQERSREEAPAEGDRRVRLRRAIELEHQLSLAVLRRQQAELDFFALACPDRVGTLAESFGSTSEEERAARERWLPARLEQVDADVGLTDVIEDDDAEDAAIDRATERADDARTRAGEIQEEVREARDRGMDLWTEARESCEERLPSGRG